MATEPALQELLDRTAIHDVLLRYACGVDRRDLDLVASCFVPGAAYDGALGQGTIETALIALRERLARYQSTMHFIGNQLIEVAGDTARSETYAIAYHRSATDAGPTLFVAGVRYLDDFVRADGVWRISGRVVKMEWQE
jgi:SnoaL-like protein